MLARRFALCLGLIAALPACGARSAYVGEIVHPAQFPVRSFAPIVVTHPDDPDSLAVATALADALVRGGTPAEARGPLEPAPAGARMRIEVATQFRQRSEIRWSTRPENVCGPYGCYVRQVSYPYDVLVLVGDTTLRIVDLTSQAVLASQTVTREMLGSDGPARRAELRLALASTLVGWIDPRVESVRGRFVRVRTPSVERAREFARDGRWDEATRALEDVVRGTDFANRVDHVRADVLHDLALCLRFGSAVRSEPVRTLERALALAEESVRLDPDATHRSLRDELRAQLEEARVLERQATSATTGGAAIPVPASYGAAPVP